MLVSYDTPTKKINIKPTNCRVTRMLVSYDCKDTFGFCSLNCKVTRMLVSYDKEVQN